MKLYIFQYYIYSQRGKYIGRLHRDRFGPWEAVDEDRELVHLNSEHPRAPQWQQDFAQSRLAQLFLIKKLIKH